MMYLLFAHIAYYLFLIRCFGLFHRICFDITILSTRATVLLKIRTINFFKVSGWRLVECLKDSHKKMGNLKREKNKEAECLQLLSV